MTAQIVDFVAAKTERRYRAELSRIEARRRRFVDYALELEPGPLRDYAAAVAAEDPRIMARALAESQ